LFLKEIFCCRFDNVFLDNFSY